jgi:hypothetical protein
MAGEKPVQGVQNGRKSKDVKQAPEWPEQSDLAHERDTSTRVACHGSAIAKHNPPTHMALLFGNGSEQTIGFRRC